MNAPEVSVVVPLYDEEQAVAELLSRIHEALSATGKSFEILAVNDGSGDRTGEILASLPFVRTIAHPYNKGNGAAIKSGIRAARGRLVVLLDGDGQHDPEDLPRLLERCGEYDLVIGSRKGSSPQSRSRRFANWIYNRVASYVAEHRIEDLTSGFRAARRDLLLRYLSLLPNRFSYPTTTTLAFIRSGYSVGFVPVTTRRRAGKSKIRPLRDGLRFFLVILKITALFSPLRVFVPLSLACVAVGLLYGLFKILVLHTPYSPITVFFVTTGVLVFCIGLLSEQITMIRFERLGGGDEER